MEIFFILFVMGFIVMVMFLVYRSNADSINQIMNMQEKIQQEVKKEISTDENGRVTVTTTTVTTQDKDCVNDFDNTCEHAHLSNDMKADKRYDVDSDIIVGSHGPIDTDTYDSPIRKE